MPRINDMVESKFLKKEDVMPNPIMVTITKASQHDVSLQNEPSRLKWCLEFAETDKPLVLNVTNMRLLESIFGSDDTDDWIGKKIVLYNDPSIMYAGKVTGGVRVRAPRNQPQQQAKYPKNVPVREGQVPPDAENYYRNETDAASGNPVGPYPDDDIPF